MDRSQNRQKVRPHKIAYQAAWQTVIGAVDVDGRWLSTIFMSVRDDRYRRLPTSRGRGGSGKRPRSECA